MSGLLALRRRMPLVVFLMLAVLVLMLVGFACACFTDTPMIAVERALSVLADAAPVTVVWSPLVAVLFAAPLLLLAHAATLGRASPARLQRFLL